MSIHINQVLAYLDEHPVSSHKGDFSSLLDMLCASYTEYNNIETDRIRILFDEMDAILSTLTLCQNDHIFDTVVNLCIEYQRTAFSHGICVGMHLMTELNAL